MPFVKAGPTQEEEILTQRAIMLAHQNKKLSEMIDIAAMAERIMFSRGCGAEGAIAEAKAFHDGILALKDEK